MFPLPNPDIKIIAYWYIAGLGANTFYFRIQVQNDQV